ncbi:MAG: D-alanyl-D-alanine carboxypeptidase/D-alanyl-D-alanine-endopeptidase [Proteobacteria bacterium]|nr:D-alanyl-D-alanine carboxypeptidase/D-alanyl-D-alanine-endopeptidase [Pseudomonadota bacterium]
MKASLLLFLSLLLSCNLFAEKDVFHEGLQKRLSFIFKDPELKGMKIGVEVFSLSRQESLYETNKEEALSPASTIKMLTALVALKRLGPNFTFETQVLYDGKLNGGVLQGDIYLKGGGDPHLVSERLYLLVQALKRWDLRKITGNIIVDDSTFDSIHLDENRIPTETDRAYNAPVSGLNFNYNTTTVYFRPADKVGAPPKVYVDPDTGYIDIVNKATTSKRGSAYRLVASRLKDKNGDKIIIQGSIPLGIGEQRTFFNITKPSVYAGRAFKYYLEREGVSVGGNTILQKATPSDAKSLYSFRSLPLRDIVILMNKYSNNFIADTLVKTLGREFKSKPGTTDKGLEVIREEATRIGINYGPFKVVSGSGLTRINRMSAHQFIQLLNAAYLDFDVLPELLSSFPIAGKDGTLEKRMKGTEAFGKLRAKTGTIDGVSTLVGVVQSKGGEMLAFSVLINDPKQRSAAGLKRWENYFGQALASYNRKVILDEKPESLPDVIESKDNNAR